MLRTVGDGLLLTGIVIAVAALGILTYFNLTPDNFPQMAEGTVIAFLFAVVFVGIDLQNSVNLGGKIDGRANTAILLCWQGWAGLIGWGAVDAAVFQGVLWYPDWASQTFHFGVTSNIPATGALVGVSAVAVLRSKLFKFGNADLGLEAVYVSSSSVVQEAVTRRRAKIKDEWIARLRPSARNIAAYPDFFTDLETYMKDILQGSGEKTREALTQEFQRLRQKYSKPGDAAQDAAINGSADARGYLVSAVLDYLGHADLRDWAKSQQMNVA